MGNINIFVPIVLLGLLVFITLIIFLAEKFLGDHSEKKIYINDDTTISVTGDDTALNVLTNNKIYLPSACGGKATCGTCKFQLIDYDRPPRATELPFLSKQEIADGVRLSCQTKVTTDLRIVLPKGLLTAKEYIGLVESVEDLTYDTKLVRFKLDEPMDFKPGQYIQIRVPGIDAVRAYSIASSMEDPNHIELIIRFVPKGEATTFVHKAMIVGDKIPITGPFGDFFLNEESDKPIIMIAGGSGKAPIRSIVYRLMDLGFKRKASYFFGARTTKDLYLTDYFLDISKRFPNFEYIPALSHSTEDENWTGETGLITDVVGRFSDDLSNHEAYLCGSPGMIDACIRVLKSKGMPEENIYFDKF